MNITNRSYIDKLAFLFMEFKIDCVVNEKVKFSTTEIKRLEKILAIFKSTIKTIKENQ